MVIGSGCSLELDAQAAVFKPWDAVGRFRVVCSQQVRVVGRPGQRDDDVVIADLDVGSGADQLLEVGARFGCFHAAGYAPGK